MGALFSTLCNSGTVVLGNPLNMQDRAETVNIFAVTPSILDVLTPPSGVYHYPRLQRIVLGGETPSQKLITDWRKTTPEIWIAYGPTEATCTILTGALQTDSKTGLHYTTRLGQCIPSSSVMLVDQDMQLIKEFGVEGEMFVTGRCLASGYWDDENLNNEKFILYRGERVYRTGDMAKWVATDSGSRELEFLGRRDRITKIRGFLVNLAQDVDAKVLQLDDRLSFSFSLLFNGHLVSVVGPSTVDTTSLLASWKKNSPAYMVPDYLLILKSLPTMNGKTDVKALKSIITKSVGSTMDNPISPISTLSEAVITALSLAANISIDRIDVKQSAISYGINSLAAIKISSLCRQYGFTVPVRHVLLEPSIQSLIDRCIEQRSHIPLQNSNLQCQQESKITPLQKALLLPTMDNPEMNYVQHLSHYATADIDRIKKAWEAVVSVEPMFRISFSWSTEEPTQKLLPQATFNWEETTVKSHHDIEVTLKRLLRRADLSSNFAVLHYEGNELSRGQITVVWTVHHALVDGFSASLIFQKVDAALEGQPFEGSLPFTVAARDMEHLRHATNTDLQVFWNDRKTLFSDACGDIASLNTSLSPRQAGHAQVSVHDGVDREKVIEYACTVNVTPAAIFNAAWILLLTTYTNSDTIVYGSVFSGRNLPFSWADTMIGPLIQTLPVLVQVDRSLSAESFLHQIHCEIQDLASVHVSEIPSNIPTFSTTVTVQDGGLRKGTTAIKCLQEPSFKNTANVPLNLVIDPNGGISLFYRTDKFSPSQVQDMADIYGSILHSLIRGQLSVQQCLDSKFPSHMREKILAAGNSSSTSSFTRNTGQTISSLFQYSAWQHAPEISIRAAEKELTYTQLAERVDKIANIITFLIPAGAVVAVLADRSSNWIVGMLAAMQANTIYCPVDASYPEEYRLQLLERSGARILLLPDTSYMEKAVPHGPLTLAIDHLLNSNIKPADCQTRLPHPHSTAYLCFTSGSTGQPKGASQQIFYMTRRC
jgi:non-ribosomal peptide synthetase component F